MSPDRATCDRHRYALTALFTVLSALSATASFGSFGLWDQPFGAPLLVAVFSLSRFVEAYMTTMVFVIIGERFPRQRNSLARLAGAVDRAMVTLGVFLSIPLVAFVADESATQQCF